MKYQSNFVFGYGSLVNIGNLEQYLKRKLNPGADYIICSLNNFQRCWNVAMDNRVNLPNYKYYLHQPTGKRLDGYVAFLNIRPHQHHSLTGILFRVSDRELEHLDRRERNYQRINITEQLDTTALGNAWTYIGLPEAEQRYQTGLTQTKTVIAQHYLDSVHQAYLALGSQKLAHYIATTEQPEIPIVNLERCSV